MPKWREVTPEFYTFTEVGESIEGTLLVAGSVEINGADVSKYTVQRLEADEQVSFLGGKNLDGLMEQLKVGDTFKLEFQGVKRTRSNRNVKTFKLYRPANEAAAPIDQPVKKRERKAKEE